LVAQHLENDQSPIVFACHHVMQSEWNKFYRECSLYAGYLEIATQAIEDFR
jgi:hypothetical protein